MCFAGRSVTCFIGHLENTSDLCRDLLVLPDLLLCRVILALAFYTLTMATTGGQATRKRSRSKFDGVLPTSVRRRKSVRKHELDHDMGEANMMFALGDLDAAMAAVHEVMTKAPCKLRVERAASTAVTIIMCRLLPGADHGPAFRLAAHIFSERGQRSNAIDALRLAVDADDRDVAAYRQLAILLRCVALILE